MKDPAYIGKMILTGRPGGGIYKSDGSAIIDENGQLGSQTSGLKQWVIMKPEVGTGNIVNAQSVAAGDVAAATLVRTTLDYPRNLLYTLADNASNTLEAVFTTVGTDQFGATVTESVTVDYNVAATTAGSQIFATITSIAIDVTNNAAGDTASVGVAIAADVASFGLPDALGAVTDVKSVNWIDAGTSKTQNIDSTSVVVARSCFRPEQAVDAADDYVIMYEPTATT